MTSSADSYSLFHELFESRFPRVVLTIGLILPYVLPPESPSVSLVSTVVRHQLEFKSVVYRLTYDRQNSTNNVPVPVFFPSVPPNVQSGSRLLCLCVSEISVIDEVPSCVLSRLTENERHQSPSLSLLVPRTRVCLYPS